MYNVTDEVPENTRTAIHSCDGEINMNDLIAVEANILFVVLDSLRFDIAFQEQEAGNTPNINRYGRWIKCEAAGNFTWPSHHSMFSGFMPKPLEAAPGHSMLFFPKDIGLGRLGPKMHSHSAKRRGLKGWKTKVTALSAWVASPFLITVQGWEKCSRRCLKRVTGILISPVR